MHFLCVLFGLILLFYFPRFLLATSGSRAEEKEQSELSNQFPFAALWDFQRWHSGFFAIIKNEIIPKLVSLYTI